MAIRLRILSMSKGAPVICDLAISAAINIATPINISLMQILNIEAILMLCIIFFIVFFMSELFYLYINNINKKSQKPSKLLFFQNFFIIGCSGYETSGLNRIFDPSPLPFNKIRMKILCFNLNKKELKSQ